MQHTHVLFLASCKLSLRAVTWCKDDAAAAAALGTIDGWQRESEAQRSCSRPSSIVRSSASRAMIRDPALQRPVAKKRALVQNAVAGWTSLLEQLGREQLGLQLLVHEELEREVHNVALHIAQLVLLLGNVRTLLHVDVHRATER